VLAEQESISADWRSRPRIAVLVVICSVFFRKRSTRVCLNFLWMVHRKPTQAIATRVDNVKCFTCGGPHFQYDKIHRRWNCPVKTTNHSHARTAACLPVPPITQTLPSVPALEPLKQEYAPLTAAVERLTERIHELERALNEEKRMRQEQEREWKRDKEKERKVREDEEKEKRAKMDQDRTPQSSDRKAEEKKANEEKKAVQVHAPSMVTEAKEREQKTVPPRTSSGVPANANASASTVPGSIILPRATPTAPLIRQPVALTYRPLNLPPHTIVADEKGPTIRAEDIRAWVQECVLSDATTGKRIREWIRESVLAEVDDVYS